MQDCVLEGIPCAALLFDASGKLLAANMRAGTLHNSEQQLCADRIGSTVSSAWLWVCVSPWGLS
jgi:hypothetical protein